MEEGQRFFQGVVVDQSDDGVPRAQVVVSSRDSHELFPQYGGDQAVSGQAQIGQNVLGGGTTFVDLDFKDSDAATGQRGAGNDGADVQKSEHLFGHHFAFADGHIDPQLADHRRVVGATDDGHDFSGAD